MKGESMNNNQSTRTSLRRGQAQPRALIYIRSATREQMDPLAAKNIQLQYRACRSKAKQLRARVDAEYSDIGASAANLERRGMNALLARLNREPRINYLIVHRLDRLTRSVGDHLRLWHDLQAADVTLVSCS